MRWRTSPSGKNPPSRSSAPKHRWRPASSTASGRGTCASSGRPEMRRNWKHRRILPSRSCCATAFRRREHAVFPMPPPRMPGSTNTVRRSSSRRTDWPPARASSSRRRSNRRTRRSTRCLPGRRAHASWSRTGWRAKRPVSSCSSTAITYCRWLRARITNACWTPISVRTPAAWARFPRPRRSRPTSTRGCCARSSGRPSTA